MKNFAIKSLFLAFSLMPFAFAEPPNLSLLRTDVLQYHDTGLYAKELALIINQANKYIEQEIAANNNRSVKKKLALILDIDETSLTNYPNMLKNNFVADRAAWHTHILAADDKPIEPMLRLYRNALKQGVAVFFVTGRTVSDLEPTKTNLIEAGYKKWTGLYARPNEYSADSIVPFKAKMRSKIHQKGYTIIANIGDQYSDLLGGYAKREFKLPNPYYFIP